MPSTYIPGSNIGIREIWNNFYAASPNDINIYAIRNNFTYPGDSTSIALGDHIGARLNWMTVTNTLQDGGTVEVTYPYTVSATSTTLNMGKQIVSGVYGYYTIKCIPAYGYTFKGWYDSASGGNQISTAETYNVSSGTSANELNVIYAQYDQAGNTCSINPDNMYFQFDTIICGGSTSVITVSSNTTWSVSDSETWISTSVTNGSGNDTFTVSCTSNSGGARTGEVTVTGSGVNAVVCDIEQTASGNYCEA